MISEIVRTTLTVGGVALLLYPTVIEPALRNHCWRKWEQSNPKSSDS